MIGADEKQCPRCAETVKAEAQACRFCGHDFVAGASSGITPRSKWKIVALVVVMSLVVLQVVSCQLGLPEANVSEKSGNNDVSSTSAVNATATSIAALTDDFSENEVAAQRRWGDQPLAITGTVRSIELGLTNDPVVSLEDAGLTINAYFNKTDGAATADLKKGQRITFVCHRLTEVLGSPSLSECQVATDVHEVTSG